MRVETYLKQGLLLDKRINYHIKELGDLRIDACNISAPAIGRDKVMTSPSGDAPFVKALLRIEELQEKINREIDTLVDLRNQIESVIRQVQEDNLQLLLIYKYREGMTNDEISGLFHVDASTVVRWHRTAINEIELPDDLIIARF